MQDRETALKAIAERAIAGWSDADKFDLYRDDIMVVRYALDVALASPLSAPPQEPTGASPQAEELRAANVANLREMVGMAGRYRETLLAVRECILALSPGHRTGYDWNADPLFLTLKEGRALNLIDDALKATPASPQAETSANVRAVTVHICEDCLNLRGEMCNEPCCRFCRRTMAEVAEYLDVLLIRPRIDGVSVLVDEGTPLPPVSPVEPTGAKRHSLTDWIPTEGCDCDQCTAAKMATLKSISGSSPMQDSERAQKLNEIADRVVVLLFVNGFGEHADRLVMKKSKQEHGDLGGWSRDAVKTVMLEVLRQEVR